ncbi:hypothetical protein PG637_08300 [Riemerella anatipestifer]|nr:hypothetical protein [Riemerella anatipestifer]MDY3325663.1 hypothetical protein [Riemerella anatipestifer]MDY3354205.1 hypothetical protein [Riemerella anatipestifer]
MTLISKKDISKFKEVQLDLNSWLNCYNNERACTRKHCYGKIPTQTFSGSKSMVKEKLLESLAENQKSLPSVVNIFENNCQLFLILNCQIK